MAVRDGKTVRGTSNGNDRGSNETRRRRRAWLLETYAADVKLTRCTDVRGNVWHDSVNSVEWLAGLSGMVEAIPVPTARCYRCGVLLHDGTITVDRIIPGCHGGKYVHNNIRPACGGCNSQTGAPLRRKGAGSNVGPRSTTGSSVTSAAEEASD